MAQTHPDRLINRVNVNTVENPKPATHGSATRATETHQAGAAVSIALLKFQLPALPLRKGIASDLYPRWDTRRAKSNRHTLTTSAAQGSLNTEGRAEQHEP